MDNPSPDPLERLSKMADDIDGFSHEPEIAFDIIGDAIRLVAEQLDVLRKPQ